MDAKEFATKHLNKMADGSCGVVGRVVGYWSNQICLETKNIVAHSESPYRGFTILSSLSPGHRYWHVYVTDVRLVYESPAPAPVVGSINVTIDGKAIAKTVAGGIKYVESTPMPGSALLTACEEMLAHLHTVSIYVRGEKRFSEVHAEQVRRFQRAIKDAKGGGR